MKSENDLKITGVVVSDVTYNPVRNNAKFQLVHYFAHGTEPLFLDCVLILGKQAEQVIPKWGDRVRIRAYLRMSLVKIEAVVKSITIIG